MVYPVNTWLSENGSVFRVVETGKYSRGAPTTTNEFYMKVQPGLQVVSAAEANAVADKIARLLNEEAYLEKLNANQAIGRDWVIYYPQHGGYWSQNSEMLLLNSQWVDLAFYADHFADPLAAISQVRQLVRKQIIEDFHDVRIVPYDDPNIFLSPINVSGKPFVVLKDLKDGNVFYSSSKKGDNPAVMATGRIGYTVCGYCDTAEEAKAAISDFNF